jgi:hypothetical protein
MFEPYMKYPWTAPILSAMDEVSGMHLSEIVRNGPIEEVALPKKFGPVNLA